MSQEIFDKACQLLKLYSGKNIDIESLKQLVKTFIGLKNWKDCSDMAAIVYGKIGRQIAKESLTYALIYYEEAYNLDQKNIDIQNDLLKVNEELCAQLIDRDRIEEACKYARRFNQLLNNMTSNQFYEKVKKDCFSLLESQIAELKSRKPAKPKFSVPDLLSIRTINSETAIQGQNNKVKFLNELYQKAYKNPLLKDILINITLEIIKKNSPSIEVVGNMLNHHPDEKGTVAYYQPYNKKIMVSTQDIEKVPASFMHEATHMAADIVCNNERNPFHRSDKTGKKEFKQVINETFQCLKKNFPVRDENYEEFIRRFHNKGFDKLICSSQQIALLDSLTTVRNCYDKKKWLREYIVIIPEAIARGATEDDLKIVKPLFEYYRDEFLPRVREYNIKNINPHIDIEEIKKIITR